MIRKECYVSPTVLAEVRRIVEESEIMHEDDNLWPMADRVGAQELVCSGHCYLVPRLRLHSQIRVNEH
jgi:hypothetical protein